MAAHLRPALMSLLLLTVITGVVYPLVVTGIAQMVFPYRANGSLIVKDGKVVGSALIGQPFDDPEYFWGRPSAAGQGYDGRSSSGSNLGPSSRALAERIEAEVARHGGDPTRIPSDLLTASGSGLDPDISPEAARFQAPRVAAARHLDEAQVALLVERAIVAPPLGVLGDARVNVLELNLALDALAAPALP